MGNKYQFRYSIASASEKAERQFNLQSVQPWEPRFLASPGHLLPVIADKTPNLIDLYHWGMPLSAANLMHETIAVENILQHWKVPQRPRAVLLNLIRNRRCVVLANCFMVERNAPQRQPVCVFLPEHRLFSMAAIWNVIPGQGYGFAILNQPANNFLRKLDQEKMPLLLEEKEMRTWLTGKISYSHITSLLRHVYSSAKLNAYPLHAGPWQQQSDNAELLQPAGPPFEEDAIQVMNEKLVPLGWGHQKGKDL